MHMTAVEQPGAPDLRGLALGAGIVLVGVVLRVAGSTRAQISAALADPQGYVTAAGADEFVLVVATALAWLLLCWVGLGGVLVLGSRAPGWIGWFFELLARLLLPATLHRFVSLGLGLTLLTGTSVASAAPPATMAAISVTVDWPGAGEPGAATAGAIPDWPPAPGVAALEPESAAPADPADPRNSSDYVVQPGDCLWDIAERWLAQAGRPVDSASIVAAVDAWWQANSSQVSDPNLIYPNQVLHSPDQP